ncbi:hypothetical protein [Desulfurobacterium sp.]
MVELKNLKKVDFGNPLKEKVEEIKKEAKEWSKIFERVYAQLLVYKELYGPDAVLVRTPNGSGWGEAKLPQGTTCITAIRALLFLINDLSVDLKIRRLK